ncbi:acyltransferase [Patulibacter sp. SYSU D01012]|uniref:acyltransferase family protein n=1 Tax=Patulibacter sp. SYSU D01012 TaxID=2817381 RepID=UPI001B3103BB|nr:acyltransferase [Patulibacter sp. SYSU D01012]
MSRIWQVGGIARPTPVPTSATTGGASGRRDAAGAARLSGLDGLRGAAAVGIVLVHVWMYLVPDRQVASGTLLDLLMGQLRLGMPLFFVLSGYLIFRPFAAAAIEDRPRPRLGVYALRRAARILPAYWLVILVGSAVLAWVGHTQAPPVEQLPVFLAFLQNYFEATVGRTNPPTWTVAVEVTFYAAVPLLAIALSAWTRRLGSPAARRRVLVGACVVLIVVGAAVLGLSAHLGWGRAVRDTLPARLASFGAGMLVAVLAHGRRVGPRAATGIALAGLALVALEASAHVWRLGPPLLRDLLVDTPASLGFGLLVASFALGRPRGAVVVERGPLRWYGDRSYSLYLWHFPVIYVLRAIDRWPADPAAALVLPLAVATVLAVATWHLVERPAIGWARRRTPSRPRVPAAVRAASAD